MIDKIIRFSIYHKSVVGLFVIALIAWGSYSLSRLPVDALPDITNNQCQIITQAPTLASQEVEQYVTAPVEAMCVNLPNLVEMRSISRLGLSVITLVFDDDMDPYLIRQLVTERIELASEQIPDGVGKPELAPPTTGLSEIYQYVVHTAPGYEDKYSKMELRTLHDWIVRRQLLSVPGIAEINTMGGYLKQYTVAVNPEKLRASGVTLPELFLALGQNNENTGGSYIEKGDHAYFIRGLGLAGSIDDIENIVVKNPGNIPILVRDIAKVQFEGATRYGASTRNGEGEVVVGIAMSRRGENSAEVTRLVKEKMEIVRKSLPEGVVIEPFLDRSTLVQRAIHTVRNNLVEGGLIVIFVLVLLLGNWRAGIVVASVIPLSMLFALGMMRIFGVSGNLMSLGAIDFGLIVDGAVIIVESIVHRISLATGTAGVLSRKQMNETVYSAATKIRSSAAFGEIIILVVYLPLLSLTGIEGKMFVPMAQVVSFAILGAFVLSLTYVPMASALFLDRKPVTKRTISDRIIDRLQKIYHPVVVFALRQKTVVIGGAIVLFAAALLVFMRMGGEFIPTLEEGDLAINTRIMAGSSLEKNIEVMTKLETILKKEFPEVKQVVSKIGTSEIPTDPMPIEMADVMVVLKEKDEWTTASTREELSDKIKKKLSAIPGISLELTQPVQLRFNELMTGSRSDVAVKIYGEDLDILSEKAEETVRLISDIEGVADVRAEQTTGLPQIVVKYRRELLARHGIHVSTINQVLSTAFAGASAGVVYEGERRFDLVVKLDQEFRADIENIRSLYIPLPSGGQIPLDQLADIKYEEGPMQISRDDGHRRVTLGVNVRNRDVKTVVEDVRKVLDTNLKLPAGYFVTYGGSFENMEEANKRLSFTVPAALLLILALLYFTFNSFRQTLLIFTAVPLSAIGGVFALWLRGLPFSISAGVGFIALFGVAVLNGIVLISYFNQLEKDGMSNIYQRVIEGTKVRLRPVLMTASVASLGFLPMALSTTAGAEVQRPLATVVIGGLITATLLTLVVLPVLYILFTPKQNSSPQLPVPALLFCLALPLGTNAQHSLKLSPEQAVDLALQKNQGFLSSIRMVEYQRQMARTAVNIDKTAISLTQDPTSGGNIDNSIALTQNLAFPTLYLQQKKLANATVKLTELELQQARARLRAEVMNAYYNLLIQREILKLNLYHDSIYGGFSASAGYRYQSGESNLLEKSAASAELILIKNNLARAKADERSAMRQLQALLSTTDEIEIPESQNIRLEFSLPKAENIALNTPEAGIWQQQISISRLSTKAERHRLLPDINLAWYRQTILGGYNPHSIPREYFGTGVHAGFQVGMAVPIWFGPARARIKAGKLQEQIAEYNYHYNCGQLDARYYTLLQDYAVMSANLQSLEIDGLSHADLILQHGAENFKAGNISYTDYLQHLSRAVTIRNSYYEALRQYNQTVIQLQYFATGAQQ